MKRSLMHAYVRGSDKAVPFYQEAFDAPLVSSYLNDDGTFYHAEIDIQGQIFSLSERSSDTTGDKSVIGNIMQFCLHYGEGCEAELQKAYEVLKTDATILVPLTPCDFSPLMVDLIDKYGVRWGLFI